MGFELHGHRGCRGLRPENTIAGIQHALALGVSGVEIDIAVTADGIPVLHHDPVLNPDLARGADLSWIEPPTPAIRTLAAPDLAAYDVGRIRPGTRYATEYPDQLPIDGARIPTFDEVVRLLADSAVPIRPNVELKTFPDRPHLTVPPATMAALVVAVLDAHRLAERAILQSFDWRALDWLATNRPALRRSYLTGPRTLAPAWLGGREAAGRPIWQVVIEAGGRSWSPSFRTLTAQSVAAARDAGLDVLAWTVNDPADMHRLIGWGVSGIITDRPDRLRAVLAARGMPLPPALAGTAGGDARPADGGG